MNRCRQRKAFTIVEMVIVIAVIAILAAVLIPTISGVINMANKSADQQFAASLNVQLAMYSVDNPIENESDLRDAINEYYGDEGEDYYGTKLVAKSAKTGNYFWYDYKNSNVFVGTVEEAAERSAELGIQFGATAADELLTGWWGGFSDASLRADLLPGLYLMGCKGGDLVDLIAKFENLGNDAIVGSGSIALDAQYEFAVNEMLKFVGENPADGSLEKALLTKVQTTTIVTGEGAFRCNDAENIEHVYVPLPTTIINVQNVYIYVDGEVNGGKDPSVEPLGTHAKVPVVQIPAGVKIASNGFPAMATGNAADGSYDGATILQILAKDLSELTDAEGNFMFDVQTCEPVFMLSNGAKYVMLEDKVYTLPYTEGDTPVDIGGTVGTGTLENLNVEVSFPEAQAGTTHAYDPVNNFLYIQYDLAEIPIIVTRPVDWTYELLDGENTATTLISIADGKLSIDANDAEYMILATGSINGVEKVSFTVCLVKPTYVKVGSLNSTMNGVGAIDEEPIGIEYVGEKIFTFAFKDYYTADDKVAPWDISVASRNGKFTVELNDAKDQITIKLNDNNYTFSDILDVTVGEEVFSFKVEAADHSGDAFELATREDGVVVGKDYMFRVGNNASGVALPLNKLFYAEEPAAKVAMYIYDWSADGSGNTLIGNGGLGVTVSGATEQKTMSPINTDVYDSRYWTMTRDNWESATLKFTGTGIVEIVIGRMNGETFTPEVTTFLEVVNGKNVTSYSQLGSSGDYVLWDNITLTGDKYSLSGGTLYGNGYVFDVKNGGINGQYISTNYLIGLNNANLDNVQVVGPVYTKFSITVGNDYNRPVVLTQGTCGIYNSYISNAAAPVRLWKGELTIVNSTLKGGAFANLDMRSGDLILDDVTTINQVNGNDAAANGKVTVGLGIVLWYDSSNGSETITLQDVNGDGTSNLNQFNYLAKNQSGNLAENAGGLVDISNLVDAAFGIDSKFKTTINNVQWLNTGILSMDARVGSSSITKPSGYEWATVSYAGQSGHVCTVTSFPANVNTLSAPAYAPNAQYAVTPSLTWDHPEAAGDKNYVAKEDDKAEYCYYDADTGTIMIRFEKDSSFNFDPAILTAEKLGASLKVSVTMNGTPCTGKITFTEAGDYVITYTYTDNNNYQLGSNGPESYSVTYTKTAKVQVILQDKAKQPASFDFNGTTGVKKTGNDGNIYISADGGLNVGSKSVGGQTVYYPKIYVKYTTTNSTLQQSDANTEITGVGDACKGTAYCPVFDGVVTITDNGTIYGSGTTTLAGGKLQMISSHDSVLKWDSGNALPAENPVIKSNQLYFQSATISGVSRSQKEYLFEYVYNDDSGETYHYYVSYIFPKVTKSDTCFTPDTLITLADGSQKRVDELLPTDTIMAWDFFTGTYVEKKISLLVNHGEDLYKVINLKFSDGTDLRLIGEHGVFDYDLNKYVYFTAENYTEYIGHNFVKQNLNGGYDLVQLVDGTVTEEYTSAWSVSSAETSNAFASGMLTVAPPEDFYNWIEMCGKLQYDVEQFAADVEKYGLYTYEDFADYVTPEQFVEWNGAYLKIAVEKGYFTFEYILDLIELYKGWMP